MPESKAWSGTNCWLAHYPLRTLASASSSFQTAEAFGVSPLTFVCAVSLLCRLLCWFRPSLINHVAALFVFICVVGWLFYVHGCAFPFAKILISTFGYTYCEQINDPLSCLPSIKWLIERSIERLVEGVKVWVVARVSRHVFPQPVGMVWVAAVLMSWGVVLVLHWVVDVTRVVAVFWHTRLKMTTILFHYTTYRELSMWNVLQSQQIQTPSYKIKHNVLQTKCLRTSALFLIRGTWFQQNYKI